MSAANDAFPAAVQRFQRIVASRGLRLEGLHVRRHGAEPVSHRWARDERRDVFSVSKTFTSVAVGIAQGEGLLDLDDPCWSTCWSSRTPPRRARRP